MYFPILPFRLRYLQNIVTERINRLFWIRKMADLQLNVDGHQQKEVIESQIRSVYKMTHYFNYLTNPILSFLEGCVKACCYGK